MWWDELILIVVLVTVFCAFKFKYLPNWKWKLAVFIVGFLAFALFFRNPLFAYTTARSDVVIIDKDLNKLRPGQLHDTFLVFTRDGKVFANERCIWYGKWDVSKFQAELFQFEGVPLRIYYYGFRIPFPVHSLYPNIYKFEPVETPLKATVLVSVLPENWEISGRLMVDRKTIEFERKKIADVKIMTNGHKHASIEIDQLHLNSKEANQ